MFVFMFMFMFMFVFMFVSVFMLMFVFVFVFMFMLMFMRILMLMLSSCSKITLVIPYAKHPLEISHLLSYLSILPIRVLTLIIHGPAARRDGHGFGALPTRPALLEVKRPPWHLQGQK
jgi:hypothetical protein